MTQKKQSSEAAKPFMTGSPTDENTFRQALKFFGILCIMMFMTFLVCSMTGFKSPILRAIVNISIELLILFIFYTKGIELGTDGVARGEILYQHIQRGEEATTAEKRIPFHKAKGFIIGFLGTALFLIPVLILAFTAQRQMTTAGGLPSWLEGFMRRSEIKDSLAAYTQTEGINLTDICRIIVRLLTMPFVSMVGASNSEGLLVLERISPLLVLLPAVAYGIGYLQGPAKRKLIHTEIAKNNRKRISKEKRERKMRSRQTSGGPEQLN